MTITAELPALYDLAHPECPCGAGRPGAPVWCLQCARSIHEELHRIPALAAATAARRDGMLMAARPAPSEVRTASPEPASPSPAWDALDHVLRWARYWATTLAERIGRWDHGVGAVTPDGRPAYDLAGDVAYLRRYTSALLVGPDAREAGAAVLEMAKHLERGAGQERARHPLGAPCPACNRLSLFRWDGSEQVTCAAPDCGTVMTWDDYSAMVAQAVKRCRA